MVLGSILNWVVGRSLDLTVNTICWITQKTAYGIYYVLQSPTIAMVFFLTINKKKVQWEKVYNPNFQHIFQIKMIP